MQVQPYLFFDGRCEEAADFYVKALGAEVLTKMRFDENPDPVPPGMVAPGAGKKIMHMSLRIGETTVMASDGGHSSGKPKFEGFSLTIDATDPAHAARLFAALSDGGEVRMPLAKTFFSPSFGMLTDRFGVGWMVISA